MKLTTLLFGLLLAVGWTSNAFAQALPDPQDEGMPWRTLSFTEAEALTYSWSDPTTGASGTDVPATDPATNPYQIYELLKFVYTNKNFPGPYQSAYTVNNERERDVYYGGVKGGWDIPGTAVSYTYSYTRYTFSDVTISTNSSNAWIKEITIKNQDGIVLTSWTQDASTQVQALPDGWTSSADYFYYSSNQGACTFGYVWGSNIYSTNGTITIPHALFDGFNNSSITVSVKAFRTSNNRTLTISGETFTLTTTEREYTKVINGTGTTSTENAADGTLGSITINIPQYVFFADIELLSGNKQISGWNYSDGTTLPWSYTGTLQSYENTGYRYFSNSGGGTITIPYNSLTGYRSVQVFIAAVNAANGGGLRNITVNGESKAVGSTNFDRYVWNYNANQSVLATDTYKPNQEGYTALLVSLYDEGKKSPTFFPYDGSNEFNTKDSVITFIKNNIKSVQLLTDGIRIGSTEELTRGTVFNCGGRYNKFFFLSKGQARKKAPEVTERIHPGMYSWPYYAGEMVIFKEMFEEFSPTSGESGSEITDFYREMMDGHIYPVVHDCASVIDNGHQFSMSGNSGTQAFDMTGLNFFIPDFRLKYWVDDNSTYKGTVNGETVTYGPFTVDGRNMNPIWDINGNSIRDISDCYYYVNYAQYNPTYAPKVGIYQITLDAEAEPIEEYDEDNRIYNVTLTWVSSLNEMAGSPVPQTYTIYWIDDAGEQHMLEATGVTNPTGETTITYQVPQEAHSKTITYQVVGQPTSASHSSFIATSNMDDVIIPGYEDFLALGLDHYESDYKIADEMNYYRNFLTVANENDENGLTTSGIAGTDGVTGMNTFNLFRYDAAKPNNRVKIADLVFTAASDMKHVDYEVQYVENTQVYLADKYKRPAMEMEGTGTLSVRGNGDIIIQPNGYSVNFLSIKVMNGDNVVTEWNVQDGDLENVGWAATAGSMWVNHKTDNGNTTYYLEGGGYIIIPASKLNGLEASDLKVVINGFGDVNKLAKINVDGETQSLKNGDANAQDYTWSAGYNKYVKVTSADQLTDGQYLIVCEGEDQSVAFDGSMTKEGLEGTFNNFAVIINDGVIKSNTLTDHKSFTISGNFIKSASGLYIGLTATGNGLRASATDNSLVNTVSIDADGNAVIKATHEKYLSFNSAANARRFAYYDQGNQKAIQLYKKVADEKGIGMVLMGNLPIVDQFTADVSENKHPEKYSYVLEYKPESATEHKTSGTVDVPVVHTGSIINGYYTSEDVKNDSITYGTVDVDIMTADVQMNLSATNTEIYYYRLQGKKDGNPQEAQHARDTFDMLAKLQQQTNMTYKDALLPETADPYQPGVYHHKSDVPTKGQFATNNLTYLPTVMTDGIDRHYFTEDSLHNTYGAPIWKTSVGQVKLNSVEAQKQIGWNTTWKDSQDKDCRLYNLNNIDADGYLPAESMSNVEYEPYMFRVFVYSEKGKLRNYKYVTNESGNEVITADNGTTTGPLCVWSAYVNGDAELNQAYKNVFTEGNDGTYDYLKFHKDSVDRANTSVEWTLSKANAMFGALDALETEMVDGVEKIKEDNLKILVRFYYKSKGSENSMMLRGNRDGEDEEEEIPMFYAAEGSDTPSPATAVSEIRYHGEVVSTTYYNVQGMESDKPFQGVNIVVTRFSDGTTSVSKVVR